MNAAKGKLDLGGKLRESVDRRKDVGNLVEEDQVPGAEGMAAGERMIQVDLIDPSPYQPRLAIDEEKVEALAESIKETGSLLQPIVVRPKDDGRFELIFGERRWRAFQSKGHKQIPANVRHMDDAEAFKACAAENLQRENLAPYEIARMIHALKEQKVCENNSELSRLTGISRGEIIRYQSYFKLPEATLALLASEPAAIGTTVADALGALCDEGHADLVHDVVSLVVQGRLLQTRAVQWVQDKLSSKSGPDERRQFDRPNGTRFATMTVTKKRVSIALTSDADVNEVSRLVSDALEKHSLSLAQQDKPQ